MRKVIFWVNYYGDCLAKFGYLLVGSWLINYVRLATGSLIAPIMRQAPDCKSSARNIYVGNIRINGYTTPICTCGYSTITLPLLVKSIVVNVMRNVRSRILSVIPLQTSFTIYCSTTRTPCAWAESKCDFRLPMVHHCTVNPYLLYFYVAFLLIIILLLSIFL